jgi:hypothetical protein
MDLLIHNNHINLGGCMRKITLIGLAVMLAGIFVANTTVMAQPTAVIKVVAISHQDLHDLGWLTRPSTGLKVVGQGELMYLVGANADTEAVTSYLWSVESAPPGSVKDVDSTDTKATTFVPDTTGQFVVKLEITTASGVDDTTMTITSALYVGVSGLPPSCQFCHSTNVAEWEGTDHSTMFTRGIDGIVSSHYGESCLECHTVGYDTLAANGGFADRQQQLGWTFPDTLQVGNWDTLVANFPDLAQVGNIQCENCHGPGSEHEGDKTKIDLTLETGVCGKCHDEEPRHIKNLQWRNAGHSVPVSSYAERSASCIGCHSSYGFVKKVDPTGKPDQRDTGLGQITCAACHDPHSADNEHQLRTLEDVTLNNGEVVAVGGLGKLCMNCHISRRDAEVYVQQYVDHYGPHHGPQTDMLMGTNAITFGMHIASSNHRYAVENTCVTCHMSETPGSLAVGHNKIGEHTFAMHWDADTPEDPSDDVDNVSACVNCHGLLTSFDDFIAKVDYDRDGLIEPVQHEIEGVLHEIGMLLPPVGEPGVEVTPDYTPLQLKAAYNYLFVEEDRSHGVHNFQYAVNLLRVTHAALATGDLGACAIQDIHDVPNDQGKQVRIIWCGFGGDGIGPMPIVRYNIWRRVDDLPNGMGKEVVALESLAQIPSDPAELSGTRALIDGELWDFVGAVPAAGLDEYSTIVPTLFDSTEFDGVQWSTFVVSGHTSVPAVFALAAPDSGYSLDNLAPAVPANLNALETASGVVVAWDEAVDEDVKYFALYRGTASGFDPAEPIATTTDPTFTDVDVTIGMTYYYRVSSTDFAGNKSELSSEFALLVTSVEGVELAAVPDDYVLLQNYPNPFNPSTEIAFGLPKEDHVTLVVYNVLGARVRTLAEGTFAAGHHSLVWQGDNDRGQNVGPGMYFYRLETSSTTLTMKMILLK